MYSLSNFGIHGFMLNLRKKFAYACWACAKNLPTHGQHALTLSVLQAAAWCQQQATARMRAIT
jgi:hypothetical protein